MGRVYFLDVTNRDGVQAARLEMSKFQRTMVNYYLGQMGIAQSEFGFPFIWSERNYIEANLELQDKGTMGDIVLSGWCRAVAGDVEKALQHQRLKYLSLSIPTSDQMLDGFSQILHPNYGDMRNVIATGFEEVMLEAATAAEALESIAEELEMLLE